MRKLVTGTGAKLYRNVGSYAEGKEVWEEVNIASGKPTMHEDEVAFRAKIIANPDDDTARLVFADWLQEYGQEERAEFIRVQIEIAALRATAAARASGLPAPSSYARRADLEVREREIWNAGDNVRQWWPVGNPPMSVRIDRSPSGEYEADKFAVIRRGFIESVTCTAADWLAHGDVIRAREPVTKVVLTVISPTSFHAWRMMPAIITDQYPMPEPDGPHIIPEWLFRLLPNNKASGPWSTHYANREAAIADMKAALVTRWPGVTFELPP